METPSPLFAPPLALRGALPVYTPVCLADLTVPETQVTEDVLTEKIVQTFHSRADLPGVLIMKNGEISGVLPRNKLFESLGRMYGVELFLRKPVSALTEFIDTAFFSLPEESRVDEAVRSALARPPANIYDPIVVTAESGDSNLVDLHTLLLAQSRALAASNRVVDSLREVDYAVEHAQDLRAVFYQILDSLEQVVPYHSASVLLKREGQLHFEATRGRASLGGVVNLKGEVKKSAIYHSLTKMRQPLCLNDVSKVPEWDYFRHLGQPRAWMGIGLFDEKHTLGLLSVSRQTLTPFSAYERSIASAFAERISRALLREAPKPPRQKSKKKQTAKEDSEKENSGTV